VTGSGVAAAAQERNASVATVNVTRMISGSVLYQFVIAVWSRKARIRRVKYWEIIADNLKKAGWSLGYVLAVDCEGRTIWIAITHRDDGRRFVVSADERLSTFPELESAARHDRRLIWRR
jgi:hypothetical protein